MENKIITELPMTVSKNHKNKKVVDWKHLVDVTKKIDILYNGDTYTIMVHGFSEDKKGYIIISLCGDDKKYDIYRSDFLKCRFGKVTKQIKSDYKHKVGDVVELKNGKIEILEQIRIVQPTKDKNRIKDKTIKGYKYKCLIDSYIGEIDEYSLKDRASCPVCCNQIIIKGINDIATTHPDFVQYFKDTEDAYTHSYGSNDVVSVICPDCGFVKEIIINNLIKHGIGCICEDGFSYPEKFISNVLHQLNIDFKTQLSKKDFKWCDKYKYDFYFELNNESYIIEAHGLQHYEDCSWSKHEDVKHNDIEKMKIAIRNNVKEENYIVIDCRKSDGEYIKLNVINSKLKELFDLSKVDWSKCESFALKNIAKEVCEYWNNGKTIEDIISVTKLSRSAIRNYLNNGNDLGWCSYNGKIEKINRNIEKNSKKVICLETSQIFDSIKIASIELGLNKSCIGAVCRGDRKHTGGYHFKFC